MYGRPIRSLTDSAGCPYTERPATVTSWRCVRRPSALDQTPVLVIPARATEAAGGHRDESSPPGVASKSCGFRLDRRTATCMRAA